MVRNLVIIHLEAMPQLLFWQYQAQLRSLWKLKEDSLYFTRCHTSGGATIFAYNSMFHGTVSAFDSCEYYDTETCHGIRSDRESLIRILHRDHNYQTGFFYCNYHNAAGPVMMAGADYGFEEYHNCSPFDDSDPVLSDWLDRLQKERPFALYLHNEVDLLHHRLSLPILNRCFESGGDVASATMEQLDKVVGRLLRLLETRGLLESTVIAVVGDHGWDYQKRFNMQVFRRGTFATSQVAWVPFFIHNSALGKGVTDRLASLDDFPATMAPLLVPGLKFDAGSRFPGVDLAREKREFAFTQNKFALQNAKARGMETPKAYSVTDGVYRLIVSEADPVERSGGMELYLEQLDPGNQADLLKLFAFDEDGRIAGLNRDALENMAIRSYPPFVHVPGLVGMAQRFETLRNQLIRYVREKERDALERLGRDSFIMPEESFRRPAADWSERVPVSLAEIQGRLERIHDLDRPVLMFGSRSGITTFVLSALAHYNIRVVGIVDNSVVDHHGNIDGFVIYFPDEAAKMYPDAIVVSSICSTKYNEQAAAQVRGLGLEYYSYIVDILGSNFL